MKEKMGKFWFQKNNLSECCSNRSDNVTSNSKYDLHCLEDRDLKKAFS